MANVAAPFGFQRYGTASSAPNYAFTSGYYLPGSTTVVGYRIAAGYATAIYFGDAVRMNSAGPTGYIEQWANGDGSTATRILAGIFVGCQYFSNSRQQMVNSRYWPGSDSAGDVAAYIIDDPNAQFTVQAGVANTPFTDVYIGSTADIVAGSGANGSTVTGYSGMSLATPTTTVTLPFKVVGLLANPPGAANTDITTAFNNVIVAFNNQTYKALLGV